jgi:hypothetical protein
MATLEAVAMSYLTEGLECYVAGLYKAAAVMVGSAAESVILDLRHITVQKLKSIGKSIPKSLEDWKIKTVSGGLRTFFEGHKAEMKRELREPFEAYWSAFPQQIRAVRNDAGHPTSVDPVTSDAVHASLLIFPELASLAGGLSRWVEDNLVV